MDITGLKKQREIIVKKRDDIAYKRKKYLEEYSDLKDIVMKTGLASLICLILQIIFAIFMGSKSATLLGLAKYFSPFVLAIFIGSLVIFISKGFDLFINADTEWSKKLADKLERIRFVEVLEDINSDIIRLDIEIDKLNKELELVGVDVDDLDITLESKTKENKVEKNGLKENKKEKNNTQEIEKVKTEVTKKESNETKIVEKVDNKKPEVKKTVVKKAVYEQKATENVDDLLSALDSFGINDDEDDDLENSSELWKKDSKILG